MASYYQSPVTKPSSLSKYLPVCLGLMLLLAVDFFGLSCILCTSTFLVLCAAYFTLFFSQTPKHCKPNHEKEEEEEEEAPEHVAPIVDDAYKDDQCITSYEHEEDHGSGLVAKSAFLFKEEGYISDEDTLIEIELPTEHYLSPYEDPLEQQKLNFNQKSVADYYYCKKYHQHSSWMELLSEENNLIEIDISTGSIMCPRFEIEAPLVF